MNKYIAELVTRDIIIWIKEWFDKNGNNCNAVIGISGGKDSTIVAKLCVEALGKDRVIGAMLPNGNQSDIDIAKEVCDYLGIKNFTINIKEPFEAINNQIQNQTEQSKINLAPRLRMATLYAISQSNNGRVANTCNLSEDYVGYSTRYGDSVGDFSPLSDLTVSEVKQIGKYLKIPSKFVDKIPSDGLCGKSDEDNLGFSYKILDTYIRSGVCEDVEIKNKIDNMHYKNLFKLKLMDVSTQNHYEKCGSVTVRLDGVLC